MDTMEKIIQRLKSKVNHFTIPYLLLLLQFIFKTYKIETLTIKLKTTMKSSWIMILTLSLSRKVRGKGT